MQSVFPWIDNDDWPRKDRAEKTLKRLREEVKASHTLPRGLIHQTSPLFSNREHLTVLQIAVCPLFTHRNTHRYSSIKPSQKRMHVSGERYSTNIPACHMKQFTTQNFSEYKTGHYSVWKSFINCGIHLTSCVMLVKLTCLLSNPSVHHNDLFCTISNYGESHHGTCWPVNVVSISWDIHRNWLCSNNK